MQKYVDLNGLQTFLGKCEEKFSAQNDYTASDTSILIDSDCKVAVNLSASENNALKLKNDGMEVTVASDSDVEIVLSEHFSLNKRYGYRIKKNEPAPYERVEYLYDAVGMTPAHMDFKRRF